MGTLQHHNLCSSSTACFMAVIKSNMPFRPAIQNSYSCAPIACRGTLMSHWCQAGGQWAEQGREREEGGREPGWRRVPINSANVSGTADILFPFLLSFHSSAEYCMRSSGVATLVRVVLSLSLCHYWEFPGTIWLATVRKKQLSSKGTVREVRAKASFWPMKEPQLSTPYSDIRILFGELLSASMMLYFPNS